MPRDSAKRGEILMIAPVLRGYRVLYKGSCAKGGQQGIGDGIEKAPKRGAVRSFAGIA
jgi:hypothetical protein